MKYGAFAVEMHRYFVENPEIGETVGVICDSYDVYDGSSKALAAARYIRNSGAVGLKSAVPGFRSYGMSGAASVLQVFRGQFQEYARRERIELHACSMAIADLALNIATAGAGSVTALSGFGIVIAGIGVLGTLEASQKFAQACFMQEKAQ